MTVAKALGREKMANTITGMVKILKQSFFLTKGFTLAVLTGSSTKDNIFDLDRATQWTSSGSNDSTLETVIVTFTTAQSINRLMIIDMNFKQFNIQYWDGTAYTDFTGVFDTAPSNTGVYGTGTYGSTVYGTEGTTSAINFLINGDTTKYFEFDTVSTTQVRISVTKTIATDAEKFLHQFYVGAEIGTFIDDITSSPNSYSAVKSASRSNYIPLSNGGTVKYKRSDKYASKFKLKELWETSDQDIVNAMYDDGQFAILPCGAVPYIQRGWRLEDLFHVIIQGDLESDFSIGRVADIGLEYQFSLLEQ